MKNPEFNLKHSSLVINPNDIVPLVTPGEVGLTYELTVRDGLFSPNGRVINHVPQQLSKSFVQQFMQLWFMHAAHLPDSLSTKIKMTNGTSHQCIGSFLDFAANAGIGDANFGLVVGTGIGAPTITDFQLAAIIQHDATPPTTGRMQYGAVSFGAPAADPTTSQFTITRNFANASGGNITVTEIGIYVQTTYLFYGWLPGYYYLMTVRDLVAGGGGILVSNGQTLTVNYRPQSVI
jgi:hypothetical protein